ncbi:LacI family DNA-binding transcriptional regulator [Ammoniphilus sp. 3BR4]|uniref:LacI family DNA-binding transcriptional regulator n=1 Tax=Ammoniphilus sp. 3BR4 TaxID=3158265 RepID=UPI003464E924
MKVTIYDVAREAGVSIATVSNLINNKGHVGKKTKKHVLEVMGRLNYQPNFLASALTGKQTYTLGLVLPDISNPYYGQLARAIESKAIELGYSVILCSTYHDDDRTQRYISLLQQKKVDGIMIGTGESDNLLDQLHKLEIPIALVGRDISSLSVTSVLVDDFLGGYLATKHLVELGHTKIAIITEDLNVFNTNERLRGYKFALEEADIPFCDQLLKTCDFTVEDGKARTVELLENSSIRPSAVFACNDLLGIGVIQAAKEMGLQVPADLSVVGFDNIMFAAYTDPALTTVSQPIDQIGMKAVDLLVDEINNKEEIKQRVTIRPQLVIRQSTTTFHNQS